MRSFRTLCLAFLLGSSLAVPASGSAEGGVESTLSAATISTKAGYRFAVELDPEGRLKSLVVTYKDESIPVPKEELPAISKADLRQTRVAAPSDGAAVLDGEVILIIPFQQEFRRDPKAGPKDDRLRTSNVVRLRFGEAKIIQWEMAVSLGEESSAWRFTAKNAGDPVQDNGTEEGLTNPYWTGNHPAYSTPWSPED